MDVEYNDVIDFSGIKKVLDERGIKVKYLAEKAGILPNRLTQICKNNVFPKSDSIARMASVLRVPLSMIVKFKIEADDKKSSWFKERVLPYTPSGEIKGELTYEPLRLMMQIYLDYINELKDTDYSVNDLFDKIEPYRRRNGLYSPSDNDAVRKSLMARGYDPDYKADRVRHYVAKGLPPETRTKLRNDRPLNIRTVYDICNFFGCSIDWVMSYK